MKENNAIEINLVDFFYIVRDGNTIPNQFTKNVINESDTFQFEDVNFIDFVDIKKLNIQENIFFNNCNFSKVIKFSKSSLNKIWFKNCTFNEILLVEGGKFNDSFWFQDCNFKESFIIRNGYFENFFFNNSESNKEIRIDGGDFKRLHFIPKSEKDILKISGLLTFIDELSLTSNNGIKIIAEKTIIKKISCKGYLNNNSRIDFNDIRNNFNIEFNNVKNDGKIYLSKFQAILNYPLNLNDREIDIIDSSIFKNRSEEYLKLIKTTKAKTVSELYNNFQTPNFVKEEIIDNYFSKIIDLGEKVDSSILFFKIQNSSIGYLELIDFEIDQFKNIFIESSDLSSIKLINSSFPINNNSISSVDETFLNHYSIYNNLYISAKNQNNIKDRNKYFQASQKYLLKNLKTNLFTNLPSITSNLISKLFSNYGQSWIQSLIVTVILSTSFFGFYLLSFKNIEFDFSCEGWMFFQSNYLKFTPEFINPTHKIDFIEDLNKEIGEWTRFFDFLGRVVVGIGIYETIKSFRKYVN